jgi:hypothetical protein
MSQYVRVDVQVLKSDLNDLQESITALKRIFGETSTGVESLRAKWRGEAAEKFMNCFSQETQMYDEMIKELELMQEKLVQSQKYYANAKDALRQLVDNFLV